MLTDLPRLSAEPWVSLAKVTRWARPRPAVRFDTIAFSMLAIEVISCRSGPGEAPVTADAYVVGGGVGGPRKAFISCFLARVRDAWHEREESSRMSSTRIGGIKPFSKVAFSEICYACLYGETFGGAVCVASAKSRA